jgi:maltooligosyltrehalose trehalohydrolase
VNYDGDGAEGVRRHVVGNACYWIHEYHVDGLRLDAVHAIVDTSPTHILAELGAAVNEEARALGREVHVVAESNRNDRRIVVAREQGGYGLASQWSDDFHHSLRVTLTGVAGGYYEDFQGRLDDLEVAIREAFVYQGRFSRFREQMLGTPAADLPGEAFVIFDQNHDQIGNQAFGDRLTTQVALPAVKVAAASVLLAPYLPLLFMGEEYGETAPFQFFTSFGDPSVVEAVRVGRRQEFAKFQWSGEIPDPEDPATFARSRLDRTRRVCPPHAHVWAWYRALFRLRRGHPALGRPDRTRTRVLRSGRAVALHRWSTGAAALAILSYDAGVSQAEFSVPPGAWRLALDSEAPEFGGEGGSAAPASLGGTAATLSLRAYQALCYVSETAPS